jgi:hypothetical protein
VKPVETQGSNTRLILPEEEGLPDDKRRGDLPIERCLFNDPETDEQKPGFESTWIPDDGERRAIVNGAPVVLRLWGNAHPPVKITVGDIQDEDPKALVTVEQTQVAATRFYEELAKKMAAGEQVAPEEIPALFKECLRAELQRDRPKPRHSGPNGNGPSTSS